MKLADQLLREEFTAKDAQRAVKEANAMWAQQGPFVLSEICYSANRQIRLLVEAALKEDGFQSRQAIFATARIWFKR